MGSKARVKNTAKYTDTEIAYLDYLEQREWEDHYLKRELQKTAVKLKNRFDEFWNNWSSKNPVLRSPKKLKEEFRKIIIQKFNDELLVDEELRSLALEYENTEPHSSDNKSFAEMMIDNKIRETLSLPELMVSAYENPKGLIEGLKREIENYKSHIKELEPLALKGRKFTGREITNEHLKFYNLVEAKQIELEKTFGKGHLSSYKKALIVVLKERGITSVTVIEREYKAFNKYKKNRNKSPHLKSKK